MMLKIILYLLPLLLLASCEDIEQSESNNEVEQKNDTGQTIIIIKDYGNNVYMFELGFSEGSDYHSRMAKHISAFLTKHPFLEVGGIWGDRYLNTAVIAFRTKPARMRGQ